MLHEVCLGVFLCLLMLAAITDLRERRIPNWLTAAVVALYPLGVVLGPDRPAWLAAVAIAVAVFALGALLYAKALIGGGDVKLITAVSLWAGPELLGTFALVTALAGGALGMAALWYQRWRVPIEAGLARLGLATAGLPTPSTEAADGGATSPDPTGLTLPYGVAIAAGGVAVVIEMMKL